MKKTVGVILLIVVLVFAYWWGGNSPGLHGWVVDETIEKTTEPEQTVEPEIVVAEEEKLPEAVVQYVPTCTMSIRCDTILDNIDWLSEEKHFLIPDNAVIYGPEKIEFVNGETVFDLLLRTTKNEGIHMEYVNTPAFDSAYIEGINNIYEFDCGELSGWMYKVNGVFPSYSSSLYTINDNDVIEWVYTCNLGKDVGGGNFQR